MARSYRNNRNNFRFFTLDMYFYKYYINILYKNRVNAFKNCRTITSVNIYILNFVLSFRTNYTKLQNLEINWDIFLRNVLNEA